MHRANLVRRTQFRYVALAVFAGLKGWVLPREMRVLSRAAPPKELVRAVSRRMSVIRARADIPERRTNVAQNFTKLRRLALKTVRFGCVASTGSLEPDITAEDLADIDLLERVLVDLRGGGLLP